MKRIQYCFWCGKELGFYESSYEEVESCGDQVCEKELLYCQEYDTYAKEGFGITSGSCHEDSYN